MKFLNFALCVCAIGMCFSGCKAKPSAQNGPVAEPGVDESASVPLKIQPTRGPNGSTLLLATYEAEGKVAKFEVEIDPSKDSVSDKNGAPNFQFGKGAFIAEPGSDASALLAKLKTVLEAKKMPANVKRVDRLSFNDVVIGVNQSKASSGFVDKPAGHWTAMKIFLESEDGDEGEVFLNFNTVNNEAEFLEKDADYGDLVLAKLATVL